MEQEYSNTSLDHVLDGRQIVELVYVATVLVEIDTHRALENSVESELARNHFGVDLRPVQTVQLIDKRVLTCLLL